MLNWKDYILLTTGVAAIIVGLNARATRIMDSLHTLASGILIVSLFNLNIISKIHLKNETSAE